jgi:hypothetical protein
MDNYDTLEYSRVKAIAVSVCLRNFLCALINTNTYGIIIVAFTQKYLGYRIFHRERRKIILANSSKDNPRLEIER